MDGNIILQEEKTKIIQNERVKLEKEALRMEKIV